MVLLAGLDAKLVANALSAITDHFHTDSDIGWYSSGYKLTVCALQFFFGKLTQFFAIKRILCSAVVIFIFGSILCAAATSSSMLVAGRAVSGVGCAGAIACLCVITVCLFPPRIRPLFMAGIGLVEMVSNVSGPLLGGAMTQFLSWRWCFWILVPLGGIVLFISVFIMPDIETERAGPLGNNSLEVIRRLDLLGIAIFLSSMICLFLGLGWASLRYSWSDPKLIGLLVTSPVLLGAFIYDQYLLGDRAAVPLHIAKNQDVIDGMIYQTFVNSASNVTEYYMPTYFQAVHGFSPSRSGYQLIPLVIGATLAFTIGGAGTTALGYYKPFMIAGAVILPISIGLLTTWHVKTSIAPLIIYPALTGFGGSIGVTAPYSAIQLTMPKVEIPLASAIFGFSQNFGSAVTVSIAQSIFSSRLKANFQRLLPGVDPTTLQNLGLRKIKAQWGSARVNDALLAFDDSLIQTWYLALTLACLAIIAALAIK